MSEADPAIAACVPAAAATVPRATYRLQLHPGFDFQAATQVLPYLAALGISHVYCSPISRARPGSLHGYDVMDHAEVNPELGGRPGFDRFAQAARQAGLGLLLDQVPNHMGVFGSRNPWWMDVLENGQSSAFAHHFDIDWHPPNRSLDAKLLVPVLGDSYGEVLERGGLQLHLDAATGGFAFAYEEHRFPIDPQTCPDLLDAALAHLPAAAPARARLAAASAAFGRLPTRDTADAEALRQRADIQPGLKAELSALATDPVVAAALQAALADWNGPAAEGWADRLDRLHGAQAWRLSYWRVASGEINYRRFFDVNALAALRVEDPAVFEATHRLVLALAACGSIDGLRIDHPDGLHDPAAYFVQLQAAYAQQAGLPGAALAGRKPLYVVAEKILAADEELPEAWAVHGTTGYDFAALVNGLFIERESAAPLQRLWQRWLGSTGANGAEVQDESDCDNVIRSCKRRVARGALRAQLTVLAGALQHIALAHRRTRDHSFQDLADALAEVAACMPVYRTYVVDGPSAQDRRCIDSAVAAARRGSDLVDDTVFDLVRQCLLAEPPAGADAAMAAQVRAFAMRFQQFCAPVAAKGVEDTAFYRLHRLVSLNEVGADPRRFGTSATRFHAANARRAARWPHTLLATSTHDNKRAEDVRARIDVLSERPGLMRSEMLRWRAQLRTPRGRGPRATEASASDLYLLYQTLIGTLPATLTDAEGRAEYSRRIAQYMQKAARESKLHTRWDRPDAGYEQALAQTVQRAIAQLDSTPAGQALTARARACAWWGAYSSVSMAVLKCTCPGVPDTYQGTELADLSLVDPDNRRPVDFALRQQVLAGFQQAWQAQAVEAQLAHLNHHPDDGRIKLWCLWRLLQWRRAEPALLAHGAYLPLRVAGPRRAHAIGYARQGGGLTLVVLAARKLAGLGLAVGQAPTGAAVWADTRARLPPLGPVAEGVDALTGRRLVITAGGPGGPGGLDLADAFAWLPVVACVFRHDAQAGLASAASTPPTRAATA